MTINSSLNFPVRKEYSSFNKDSGFYYSVNFFPLYYSGQLTTRESFLARMKVGHQYKRYVDSELEIQVLITSNNEEFFRNNTDSYAFNGYLTRLCIELFENRKQQQQ